MNPRGTTQGHIPLEMGQEKNFLKPKGASFDENTGTLLLTIIDEWSVDVSAVQEAARKNGLTRKDEFHITVLDFKNGAEVKKALQRLPEDTRQHALSQIKTLIDGTDWSFAFEPQKYHISKVYAARGPAHKGAEARERRESYIQMVSVPGMKIFYHKLNSILGTTLEAPPAHITLYTGGDDKERAKMGIGIHSQEEFLKLNPKPLP